MGIHETDEAQEAPSAKEPYAGKEAEPLVGDSAEPASDAGGRRVCGRCACVAVSLLAMMLAPPLCLLLFVVFRDPDGGDRVACHTVHIPDLSGLAWVPPVVDVHRRAYFCHPRENGSYPLVVMAHGESFGAFLSFGSLPVMKQIASHGFFVAGYDSCSWSRSRCDKGRASFLEALKTIRFFYRRYHVAYSIDVSLPVTIAGHGTGAQAALMVAAVRDTASYLEGTAYHDILEANPGFRDAADCVGAAVALQPPDMYEPDVNPNVQGFVVSSTSVLVGAGAPGVPGEQAALRAWKDFLLVQPPIKLYVDMGSVGGGLSQGTLAAYFTQAFVLHNDTAESLIHGGGEGSLSKAAFETHSQEEEEEAADAGGGRPGFLFCGESYGVPFAVPESFYTLCFS